MLPTKLPQTPITERAAFEMALADLQPVNGSRQLWFKSGHNRFIGTDSFDSGGPCWEAEGTGQNRKPGQRHPHLYDYLRELSETRDGGIFLIPTQPQGNVLKTSVAVSDNVAAELDNGTQEEQWEKIGQFVQTSGLTPRKIITSGGKSYHCHFQGTEHFPIEQTVYLRRLLTIALISDPAVCNPHQPMRIEGFDRRENSTLKGHQTRVFSGNERYTYDQFLSGFKSYYEAAGLTFPTAITDDWWRTLKPIIKAQDLTGLKAELSQGLAEFEVTKEAKRREREKTSANKPVTNGLNLTLSDYLEEALTRNTDRVLRDIGWNIGDRRGCCPFHASESQNSACVQEFDNGNLAFHCPTCTGEKGVDLFQVWQKQETGQFDYPQGLEYVEAVRNFCTLAGINIPEWEPMETTQTAIESPPGTNKKTPASKVTLRVKIAQVHEQHLDPADLTEALANIAKETRHSLPVVKEIYKELQAAEDKEARRESNLLEIEKIRQANTANVPLDAVLVPELAQPLQSYADYLHVRPEVLLTAFLCGLAATHHVETRIEANDDWLVAPNLWGAMVAKSAQSKTPASTGVIRKPLTPLQDEAQEELEAKTREYKRQKALYDSLKGADRVEAFPEGLPEAPTRSRMFYYTESTLEGIYQQSAVQDHGLLVLSDELSGWFSAMNQYKGGRGNDNTRMLELREANKAFIGRASGNQLVSNLVSFWGGIQPQILEGLFRDSKGDADGTWARFIFVEQEFTQMELDPKKRKVSISQDLAYIYNSVHAKTTTRFHLSQEAYEILCAANHEWGLLATEYQDHPIANVYGKDRGLAIQLAFNLHCANHAAKGAPIPDTIPAETMAAGVYLANFYALQTYSLYSRFMRGTGESAIPAKVSRILKRINRTDRTITAREVLRAKITSTSSEAIDLFKEMQQLSLGKLEKVAKSYKFTAYPEKMPLSPNPSHCHPIVTALSPTLSPPLEGLKVSNNKGFEKNITTLSPLSPDTPPSQNSSLNSANGRDKNLGEKFIVTTPLGDNGDNSGFSTPQTLIESQNLAKSLGDSIGDNRVTIAPEMVTIAFDNGAETQSGTAKEAIVTLFDSDGDNLLSLLEPDRLAGDIEETEYYCDVLNLLSEHLAGLSISAPFPAPLPPEVRAGFLAVVTKALSLDHF